jgi:putative Mn2+ efflux pump MntP
VVATIALLFALGLDTFAVALGLGMKGLPPARWLRVGITFAFFEGLMPVVGLLIGRGLSGVLGNAMGYVAGSILLVLGLWEIREAMEENDDSDVSTTGAAQQHTSWLLGLSVSLDEFAVGFSLGVLRVPIGLVLAIVAIQACAVTFLGLALGRRIGAHLQERAELVAGIIFLLLGGGIIVSVRLGSPF